MRSPQDEQNISSGSAISVVYGTNKKECLCLVSEDPIETER